MAGRARPTTRENVAENRAPHGRGARRRRRTISSACTRCIRPTSSSSTGPGPGERPRADGMVTRTPGVALAIATADCGPVLFADAQAGCHRRVPFRLARRVRPACWRGRWKPWRDLGARPHAHRRGARTHHRAARLRGRAGVRRALRGARRGDRALLQPSERAGHMPSSTCRLHRAAVCRRRGSASFVDLGLCTYSDADRFFSYRRTTHRREPDYGRPRSRRDHRCDGAVCIAQRAALRASYASRSGVASRWICARHPTASSLALSTDARAGEVERRRRRSPRRGPPRASGTPAPRCASPASPSWRLGDGRAGPYGVDADAGRQRLRHGDRGRVQGRLGERVGEMLRRQLPDPLVDDVDDATDRRRRRLRRRRPRQQDGRAQVDRELPCPTVAASSVPQGVRLEQRRVVDEKRQRAEPCGRGRGCARRSPGRRDRPATTASQRHPPR